MQVKVKDNPGPRPRIGKQQTAALVVAPTAPTSHSEDHMGAGLALGLLFGFVLGSVLALSMGPKGLSLAQQLWGRYFGEHDGERVHFELLLQ